MRGCLRKAQRTRRGLAKGEESWDIILPLGRGPDGKHKQKWIRFHGTRKQADEKLTELVRDVHRGEFIEATKLTVGEWLDDWMEKAIRPPRCTQNTYSTYSGIVRNYLKPRLGHVRLQQLSPLTIERYYADLTLAPRSTAVHHVMLTSALNVAMNAGLLRVNVARRVSNKPRVVVTGDLLNNVWNADEANQFLAAIKQRGNVQVTALFALALDSGARKAELLGLKWCDLEGAILQIERQITRLGKGGDTPTFTLPKSKRGRAVDLSAETLALLKTHKAKQAELRLANGPRYSDHGLMFAQAVPGIHTLGAPLNLTALNVQFTRFCQQAKVKRLTVHGLRHTCATLLLSAGIPAHVVQRRLGHAKVEITLNLYAHVLPGMQADAASRLATLLHG